MGLQDIDRQSDANQLQVFMKALLNDVRALEHMLAHGHIEKGVCRIGAEQELVLTDPMWRPAPIAPELLAGMDDPAFTTELGRFNLEFNLDPLLFEGNCLRQLESDFNRRLAEVRDAAQQAGARVLLVGTLPTLQMSDLALENMTPNPRYFALNDAMRRLRGAAFELRLGGTDELIVRHDSLMLEACNTSAQFHFQVSPDEFAKMYNISQVTAGPVLAAATNSPLLFGRRLWRETRIALFEQAVDTRQPGHELDERSPRVRFGNQWVDQSVIEIFREDVARFRVVLAMDVEENPFEVMDQGLAPRLKALQLHNSTVYRWMRACYGVLDGRPHLRIENRILPSGPTVIDEVANAAFWFGMVTGLAQRYEDIRQVITFEAAKNNFLAAAKFGLDTQLTWFDGTKWPAQKLIGTVLLPLAREGLQSSGIDEADIDRYLGVVAERVETGRTGSQWLLESFAGLQEHGTRGEQLTALTAAAWSRQQDGQPVHEWSQARMEEAGSWQKNYLRIEQYMTTDVFSVHEDEVIDLVASLMDWERIRHVPVEDSEHRLVGLISYRQLLRFLSQDLPHGKGHPVPARQVMQPNPITTTPETSTLDAIELMRRERVACLPVVKDDRLVGIVTEADFMRIAAQVLETQLRNH